MIIRLTIDVELDDELYGYSDEEIMWMEGEVLIGSEDLYLHSNYIGDEIGKVVNVKDIQWIKEEQK